ncbi:hypothetical protein BXY51_005358 [Actinoplanes cyaneus]|nr:hypothetical protein [Actinoplanes cyaneus]
MPRRVLRLLTLLAVAGAAYLAMSLFEQAARADDRPVGHGVAGVAGTVKSASDASVKSAAGASGKSAVGASGKSAASASIKSAAGAAGKSVPKPAIRKRTASKAAVPKVATPKVAGRKAGALTSVAPRVAAVKSVPSKAATSKLAAVTGHSRKTQRPAVRTPKVPASDVQIGKTFREVQARTSRATSEVVRAAALPSRVTIVRPALAALTRPPSRPTWQAPPLPSWMTPSLPTWQAPSLPTWQAPSLPTWQAPPLVSWHVPALPAWTAPPLLSRTALPQSSATGIAPAAPLPGASTPSQPVVAPPAPTFQVGVTSMLMRLPSYAQALLLSPAADLSGGSSPAARPFGASSPVAELSGSPKPAPSPGRPSEHSAPAGQARDSGGGSAPTTGIVASSWCPEVTAGGRTPVRNLIARGRTVRYAGPPS